jgi:chemotaxis protein MotA
MKAITLIGICGAYGALLLAVLMEGGSPASLINIPAAMIVFVGTAAASAATTSFDVVKGAVKLALLSFKGSLVEHAATVDQMVALAEKARRDGLLAIEDDLQSIDDPYTRKGLQLVVDGADSDLVRAVLQSEMDGTAQRHARNAAFFAAAGGYAPTLGILGTVMSLVHVLENLDKPSTLGHAIAGAFLATLYGVSSANLIFLPIAGKLREMSSDELQHREMLLEAILSIQAGDNPRLLREKLETFLDPLDRGARDGATATAPSAEPSPPPTVEAEAA